VRIEAYDAHQKMKQGNHLFDRLPKEAWESWHQKIEHIELQLGQVVFDVGDPITHVFSQVPLSFR